jgi:hypothetical protein
VKFKIGDIVRQEPTGLSNDNDPMYWLIVGISVDVDMVSCRPATNYKLSLLNTMGERGLEEGNITITYGTTFVETHYKRVSE